MKPYVVYFSRTGNTKRLAQAIADLTGTPLFSLEEFKVTDLDACDTLILGTPVEGASPAKETRAFAERLPAAQGKKAILFCTYRIFGNERTLKILEKILKEKGFETILKFTKKMKGKPGEAADFSEVLSEVKKVM